MVNIKHQSCLDCTSCLTLYKHPWNKTYRGPISEKANLHVCIVGHVIDKNRKGTVLEKTEIGCELFIDINEEQLKVIKKYKL